ncbi:hypothetical protein WM16_16310 [Burkholderia ubonensis]|uniref:Uncharacterized protein n=1 Tax=Burkholderia ubonensis TaxID=101571 RepID=A0A106VP43_9BURK|nr:hypothetical protein [Burkholderia ubonensis]KWC13355.1 hypothetical protein WL48_07660 [Burkholderia ubonensis]KWC29984.1 hypothetical protein WL49_29470 [Burkholderia ubonensis]KWK74240.1 hypothetical protein WM16_16310 [Burkholderia ubonensis]
MIQLSLDNLRQAQSSELYRLYLIIGKMLDDPQRTLQVRQNLRLGMTVGYVADDPFGAPRQARVVELRAAQAVVEDLTSRQRWAIRYAAIVLDGTVPDAQPEPAPPSRANREAFFIGDTVGFTDKHLRERIGIIVRLNQKTASIACNDTEGHWRVSYGLLRRIVDVN